MRTIKAKDIKQNKKILFANQAEEKSTGERSHFMCLCLFMFTFKLPFQSELGAPGLQFCPRNAACPLPLWRSVHTTALRRTEQEIQTEENETVTRNKQEQRSGKLVPM